MTNNDNLHEITGGHLVKVKDISYIGPLEKIQYGNSVFKMIIGGSEMNVKYIVDIDLARINYLELIRKFKEVNTCS